MLWGKGVQSDIRIRSRQADGLRGTLMEKGMGQKAACANSLSLDSRSIIIIRSCLRMKFENRKIRPWKSPTALGAFFAAGVRQMGGKLAGGGVHHFPRRGIQFP